MSTLGERDNRTHKEVKKVKLREYLRRVRAAAVEILGGKCSRCGFDDFRALQIDHVNGGGHKDKRAITGVYWIAVIRSVTAKENKYQLLCANCNWIKRWESAKERR